MFKLLSLALISLVGMNYANNSNNSIHYSASTPIVTGGIDYDDIESGFYLPSSFNDFKYDGPSVPSSSNYIFYNYTFLFNADYLYFKVYSNGSENMYDMRDMEYYSDISFYAMQLSLDFQTERFSWILSVYNHNNQRIIYYLISSYPRNSTLDLNGLEVFYNNIEHQCFYVSNFHFLSYNSHTFTGYNGDSVETINTPIDSHNLPLVSDNRYHSLERYFYFPYEPTTFGYWYQPQGTYYINALGNVGTYSRPTIFKGFFKNQGNYYSSYVLHGDNNEQPSSGGWYFGPYNNVSSLSQAIRPSNGSQFWYPYMGLFGTFQNLVTPVWYTLYTPITSSGTTHNVMSNEYQWYSVFYQEIYLVYEVVDTSNNLTSISDMSYYDMLSFNTGFISNPGMDVDPFTSALTLVGVAFQRVWSIGNIVLFGSITLNTLILMPILVGLVIFVIHLIKKG